MKVRISYTVEVDDRFRRAIRIYYGEEGLADREDVRRWFKTFGDTMDNEIDGILKGEKDDVSED